MINTAAPASNSVYGREKLFRYEKIIFSNQAVFCFLVPFFFFFLFFFFSLFVFVVTVDPAGHAAWINISIYILSLSPEFYFAKGISKALDLHTGHAYDQKKNTSFNPTAKRTLRGMIWGATSCEELQIRTM